MKKELPRIITIVSITIWVGGCVSGTEEEYQQGYYAASNCGGVPQAPSFSSNIDALSSYQGASTCDPSPKPGVVAFRDFILATYSCTGDSGISRDCSTGGTSEHHEGRAWDWGTTPSIDASQQLLDWLLATDEHGNKYAMARRFGIMYMIFDHKIWQSYRADKGWTNYSGSNPHTDHVHFSFSWAGANKQTSFWNSGPIPDGGPGPAPDGGSPTQQKFIGSACDEDTSCSSNMCFTSSDAVTFQDGMCTESCDMHCPDKSGEPTTYCIPFDVATGSSSGNLGYCFSGCNTSMFPGNGCRPGYECRKLARHKMPQSIRNICVPENSSSNPNPPPTDPPPPVTPPVTQDGYIGRPCSGNQNCSTGQCLTSIGQGDTFEGGMCSQSCTRLCPDKSGEPETFCLTFDTSAGSFSGEEGHCFSRCDKSIYPGTGCRSGYQCVKMERHDESWTQRNVCIPDSAQYTVSFNWSPPDAEGDLPNPERGAAFGCAMDSDVSLSFADGLSLAFLALLFSFRRRRSA